MNARNAPGPISGRNPRHRFDRRHFLIALAGVPALAAALAACGDDTAPPAPGDTSTFGPGTVVPHPTSLDDAVVRISSEGGFVPVGVAFQRTPTLLISGAGLVFAPGAEIAIYPGPLLPAITDRTIAEFGLQRVLALAKNLGLISDPVPSYDAPSNVADAPDTVVELHVDGETFLHRAYALGIGSTPSQPDGSQPDGSQPDGSPSATNPPRESSPARQHLLEFVEAMGDLAAVAGPVQLGEPQVYLPERARVRAHVVTLADFDGQDVKPTVSPWPADAAFRLADAADCVVVNGRVLTDLLNSATVLSLFTDDGVTYQLVAAPVLPGDSC